ncbi:MAG: hypothetical protein HC945_03065 [Nitrosarchaeum sp.]|nr:hypothetical protein [Nitrosarchaeum sp.]
MLGKTHIAIAVLLGLLLLHAGAEGNALLLLSFIILGSLLPDIDESHSTIGRRTKIFAWTFAHRGIFHSIIMAVFLTILLYGLFKNQNVAWFFLIGYLSHVIGEGITKAGVRPSTLPSCTSEDPCAWASEQNTSCSGVSSPSMPTCSWHSKQRNCQKAQLRAVHASIYKTPWLYRHQRGASDHGTHYPNIGKLRERRPEKQQTCHHRLLGSLVRTLQDDGACLRKTQRRARREDYLCQMQHRRRTGATRTLRRAGHPDTGHHQERQGSRTPGRIHPGASPASVHPKEPLNLTRRTCSMNALFSTAYTYAIIGASQDRSKYGNIILRDLDRAGYAVVPINPNAASIENHKAYPTVEAYPGTLDIAVFVLPPSTTLAILPACIKKGIRAVWLQPGSESPEAITYCHDHHLTCIHDVCIMVQKPKKQP